MTRSDSLVGDLLSPLLTSAASKAAPNCASSDWSISFISGCFSQRYVLYFEKSASLSKVKDTFCANADVAKKNRNRTGNIHRTAFIRTFPFEGSNVHHSAKFHN